MLAYVDMSRFYSFSLIFVHIIHSTNCMAEIREDFFAMPSQEKVLSSAKNAASTYHFQIPFYAGITAFFLFDGDVTKSLSDETPIFGSQENAKRWTDGLLLSLLPVMLYTASQVDLKPDLKKDSYFSKRTKFLFFQSAIIMTDFLLVSGIKMSTSRIRPDESDRLSFPSGHSSISSGMSRTIFNNVKNSSLDGTPQGRWLQQGSFAASSAVAWGRVEAKKHHVSDILLGNAFGAFISDFLYASFLEDMNTAVQPSVYFSPSGSAALAFNICF